MPRALAACLLFLLSACLPAKSGPGASAPVTGVDAPSITGPGPGSEIGGCPLFPADNFWNTPVSALPVHPRSAEWVEAIGVDSSLHADFGSGTWDGGPIGIPYNLVPADQPTVPVEFVEYGDESDPGPYPVPDGALPEWGGDHHILVVRQGECRLYELYHAERGLFGWQAGSGALWDLNSNALRPAGWTSSDLAGMPILPGLARYPEAATGEITHALRFTAFNTADGYVWPARHPVPDLTDAQEDLNLPPIGARFRLHVDFPIPPDAPLEIRALLQAMKTYGIVLADHGSEWYISGAPDERWDNDALHLYFDDLLRGSDFEAVDTRLMLINPDSAAARSP